MGWYLLSYAIGFLMATWWWSPAMSPLKKEACGDMRVSALLAGMVGAWFILPGIWLILKIQSGWSWLCKHW